MTTNFLRTYCYFPVIQLVNFIDGGPRYSTVISTSNWWNTPATLLREVNHFLPLNWRWEWSIKLKLSHCKTNGKNNINFVQSAPRILQSINYPQEGKKKNQQHFNEVKVELVYQSPSHYKTKQCNKYVCSSFLLYISTSHVKFSVCKWLLPS